MVPKIRSRSVACLSEARAQEAHGDLILPGLLGMMITHSRETYQPTSIMRWDRGIFNGSHDRLTSCIPMSLL